MQRLDTVEQLRAWRDAEPGDVALVPTMGALHEGHLTHLDAARERAGRVLVSVFVNPTQFGPGEDFDRYPRTPEADLAACAARGASAVFAPSVDAVYPPGVPGVSIDVPAVARGLEAEQRPGHFAGVCRVVAKLLQMTRPRYATFGRKDFQQLRVVQAMVADLAMPVEVVEVPTLREADGLAMSSRNRYLTPAGRERARAIARSLEVAAAAVKCGAAADAGAIEATLQRQMEDARLVVDYAAVRDAAWLEPIEAVAPDGPPAVAVVAARVDGTRLLDNRLLNRPDPTRRVPA